VRAEVCLHPHTPLYESVAFILPARVTLRSFLSIGCSDIKGRQTVGDGNDKDYPVGLGGNGVGGSNKLNIKYKDTE
jgi:hypothetical protein